MKKMHKYMIAALVALTTISVSAQQVNTLYFLENAPMRHTINPAFQPVSKVYFNFTPLGWMSNSAGNNSLTMSDIFTIDPKTGKTITVLHPNADKKAFLKAYKKLMVSNDEMTLGFVNVGVRIKDKGYLTIGINERIQGFSALPKSVPDFLLNGGMKDLTGGTNTFNLSNLGLGASAYTEISGGYSHQLDDQWTIGGKFKLLLGQFYAGAQAKDLAIDATSSEWRIHGDMGLDIVSPFNTSYLDSYLSDKSMKQVTDGFKNGSFQKDSLMDMGSLASWLVPAGYGAAIDFGFTYKPIEQVQISAAITDLGFIYWTNASRLKCSIDTVFEGAGVYEYGDKKYQDESGNFSTDILMDSIGANLMGMLDGFHFAKNGNKGFARMTTMRLNVGVDANFWDNRVGVGVVSATKLYNNRLYEEVTLGAAFRPFNWLNIAMSYSFIDNGKFSNIGAGLSIMPYDGVNMTLTMDYMPTSYAKVPNTNKYLIPDKMKMFNIALGFSICWGSNHRDKDKDGVRDKLDMCPDTPRGVLVDEQGCPLDEDHDGVPDYLDHCLGTPPEAIGFVDSVGCELDTDGDGVEDYRDKCPNTPEAAWGKVDTLGCPLDTDGDGVPDYLDECPETPEAAWGKVNEKGCPIDTDGDGVADYLDECPDTPEAAWGKVDEKGCPLDSDRDSVPDYLDQCPNTPEAAIGFVDAVGCELDTDGDGVPDYLDICPYVPGLTENKGCPEVKREVRQLLQKAMQGIEFELGKAIIKKKSFPLLDKIAATFIENTGYIIEVQGHTDNIGTDEVNKRLSQKRAEAVKNYLEKKGVPADRLTAVGYGPTMPIADNKTKAGRAKNRRVEFKITFEEVHIETLLEHADPVSTE
ncbi:MAG: OmpA family protein [Paludibacteraceae bacterium]|nr:OmpA family protein [Paludibacteraceae bacterium]